mmetsp:Transcript_105958/g.187631  ORF Transcript_105958/g.187631 Transcript_105958/m.187631 type:complete len:482 (+) Transcript_105958:139-1584(+)
MRGDVPHSMSGRTQQFFPHLPSMPLQLALVRPWSAMRAIWLSTLLMNGVPALEVPERCSDVVPDATVCTLEKPALTTEGGHSLVQSMSLSRRIGAGAVVEEGLHSSARQEAKSQLLLSEQGAGASEHLVARVDEANKLADRSGVNASETDTVTGKYTSAASRACKILLSKAGVVQLLLQVKERGKERGKQLVQTMAFSDWAGIRVLLVFFVLIFCFVGYFFLFHPEEKNKFEAIDSRGSCDPRAYDPRSILHNMRTTPLSPALAVRSVPSHQGNGDRYQSPKPGERMLEKGIGLVDSDDEELHFCPDLVVPQHCECILLVPFDINGEKERSLDISDMNGSIVLCASAQSPGGVWRLFLESAAGDALAQCREVRPSISAVRVGNAVEFHFLRNGGHYFGKLTSRTQDRFELHTLEDKCMHFWGNFQARAVNVTDDTGRLLATTELHNAGNDGVRRFRLRVAPLADVGLALCGILCVNRLLGI